MKAIFLAAGIGNRLKPLTDTLPKCMVKIHGKPILQYGIEVMHSMGITDIIVVKGYLAEKIRFKGVKYFENRDYDKTNMVETLFCAREEFDSDIIVSYADIVYNQNVVSALIKSSCDVGVVIDRDWHKLWSLRMEYPLLDAETLKINSLGNIIEIGGKAKSYNDIEGQFIGLIKFSKSFLPALKSFYYGLDRKAVYDGRSFENMFMTTFLQLLIDSGYIITAVPVHGGWVEVDTYTDYLKYQDKKIFKLLGIKNHNKKISQNAS